MAVETLNSFRSRLMNFFRNGQFSGADRLWSELSPVYPFRKNVGTIASDYKKLEWPTEENIPQFVKVESYSGKNPIALKIKGILQSKAANELVGAYVHGSVGTSEEVAYSDFDGLVIIKNECMEDPKRLFKLLQVLKETERIMFEMDPLQHHGWFVMTEKDLSCYPEDYFPNALFTYSKCLLGLQDFTLRIRSTGYRAGFEKSFHSICNSIENKMNNGTFFNNYYTLKSSMSECMLLPAIFIQAQTGQGIFKKFSFEKVKGAFGRSYEPIDVISDLRSSWNYKAPENYLRRKKNESIFSSGKKTLLLSGGVPDLIRSRLDRKTFDALLALLNRMRAEVGTVSSKK